MNFLIWASKKIHTCSLFRTALALILSAAIAEISMGGSPDDNDSSIVPDLVSVSALLCKQRKGVLRDKG